MTMMFVLHRQALGAILPLFNMYLHQHMQDTWWMCPPYPACVINLRCNSIMDMCVCHVL